MSIQHPKLFMAWVVYSQRRIDAWFTRFLIHTSLTSEHSSPCSIFQHHRGFRSNMQLAFEVPQVLASSLHGLLGHPHATCHLSFSYLDFKNVFPISFNKIGSHFPFGEPFSLFPLFFNSSSIFQNVLK